MSFEQSIRCLAKNCKTAPYLAASVLKSSCLSLLANRWDYCPYLTARHCPTHWSILVCCCGPLTILFYSILSWLPGKSLMLQVEADGFWRHVIFERSSIGSIGASTITWLIVWLCVCIVCRRHLKKHKSKRTILYPWYIYIYPLYYQIIIYFNASVLYIVLCIMYIYIYFYLYIYIYIPCICQLWANICQPHPQWSVWSVGSSIPDRPRYPSEYRLVLDWFDQQCLGRMFFREAWDLVPCFKHSRG